MEASDCFTLAATSLGQRLSSWRWRSRTGSHVSSATVTEAEIPRTSCSRPRNSRGIHSVRKKTRWVSTPSGCAASRTQSGPLSRRSARSCYTPCLWELSSFPIGILIYVFQPKIVPRWLKVFTRRPRRSPGHSARIGRHSRTPRRPAARPPRSPSPRRGSAGRGVATPNARSAPTVASCGRRQRA